MAIKINIHKITISQSKTHDINTLYLRIFQGVFKTHNWGLPLNVPKLHKLAKSLHKTGREKHHKESLTMANHTRCRGGWRCHGFPSIQSPPRLCDTEPVRIISTYQKTNKSLTNLTVGGWISFSASGYLLDSKVQICYDVTGYELIMSHTYRVDWEEKCVHASVGLKTKCLNRHTHILLTVIVFESIPSFICRSETSRKKFLKPKRKTATVA